MTDSVLVRAQSGDSGAFAELTHPYRRELHVHCYRILGSFQDAEDLLQETLLSAWQALDRFDGRSLRAWLYRIATNRCLNYLRDTSRRPMGANAVAPESPFAKASTSDEPWWLEPYPDALMGDVDSSPEARYEARESIALSFVAGLQRLPTQQRAALVFRDVLGFSAAEVADMLDSTPASVNSALQRARAGFEPSRDPDQVTLPRSRHEAETVERFVEALRARRLRAGRRAAHRRRADDDAPRTVRIPGAPRYRGVPRSGLGRGCQGGPDASQRRSGIWLLPSGPTRRRPSSGWDLRGLGRGCSRILTHEVR